MATHSGLGVAAHTHTHQQACICVIFNSNFLEAWNLARKRWTAVAGEMLLTAIAYGLALYAFQLVVLLQRSTSRPRRRFLIAHRGVLSANSQARPAQPQARPKPPPKNPLAASLGQKGTPRASPAKPSPRRAVR